MQTLNQLLQPKKLPVSHPEEYDTQFSYIHGRRAYCKDLGLSGKEFRECKRALRDEDSGLSLKEKRDRAIQRKLGNYNSPSYPNPNYKPPSQQEASQIKNGEGSSSGNNVVEKEITPKGAPISSDQMDKMQQDTEDSGMSRNAIILTISGISVVVIIGTILLIRHYRNK